MAYGTSLLWLPKSLVSSVPTLFLERLQAQAMFLSIECDSIAHSSRMEHATDLITAAKQLRESDEFKLVLGLDTEDDAAKEPIDLPSGKGLIDAF